MLGGLVTPVDSMNASLGMGCLLPLSWRESVWMAVGWSWLSGQSTGLTLG